MDGVSSKIEISVDDLVSTVDDHSQSWQLLLRVVSHKNSHRRQGIL
jgi:hypothetical protein